MEPRLPTTARYRHARCLCPPRFGRDGNESASRCCCWLRGVAGLVPHRLASPDSGTSGTRRAVHLIRRGLAGVVPACMHTRR